MSEWKEYKLGEVLNLIGGGTPKTSIPEYWNGVIPWLSVTDFNTGRKYVYHAEKNITELGLAKSSTKVLSKGKIIISARGTVGVVSMLGNDMAFNQSSYGIDAKDEISENHFLYYLLKNTVPQFLSNSYGAVFNTITKTTFDHIDIKLPPLPEQRSIAEVLSSLDDKIDLLHRQNKTLEQMAETLFRQWFVEEAKEEWEEVLITKLFEVRDGTHDSPKQKEIGKKLITSKHLKPNRIDFESAYYISEEDYDMVNKRSNVETKDILFSMIGTIGNIYIEESSLIDYAIKNVGLFKTSQNTNWCYFTYLWLKSDLGQEFIHENRSGSTQEYISLGSLRSIIFNMPSEDFVLEFNEEVSDYFSKIKCNQIQISTLEKMRDTLLPKLMSGDVRVSQLSEHDLKD